MKPPGKSYSKTKSRPVVAPEPVAPTLPQNYARVRLYFKDAPEMHGVWTGTKWWADGHEVFPVRWESEAAEKTVKKK